MGRWTRLRWRISIGIRYINLQVSKLKIWRVDDRLLSKCFWRWADCPWPESAREFYACIEYETMKECTDGSFRIYGSIHAVFCIGVRPRCKAIEMICWCNDLTLTLRWPCTSWHTDINASMAVFSRCLIAYITHFSNKQRPLSARSRPLNFPKVVPYKTACILCVCVCVSNFIARSSFLCSVRQGWPLVIMNDDQLVWHRYMARWTAD